MLLVRWVVVITMCQMLLLGQTMTLPGLGSRPTKPLPPVVDVHTTVEPETPAAKHQRLLADIRELVSESQTLQREVESAEGNTLSVQSVKRSQKIESLSRKIRKELKTH